jgi:hypothetical protein
MSGKKRLIEDTGAHFASRPIGVKDSSVITVTPRKLNLLSTQLSRNSSILVKRQFQLYQQGKFSGTWWKTGIVVVGIMVLFRLRQSWLKRRRRNILWNGNDDDGEDLEDIPARSLGFRAPSSLPEFLQESLQRQQQHRRRHRRPSPPFSIIDQYRDQTPLTSSTTTHTIYNINFWKSLLFELDHPTNAPKQEGRGRSISPHRYADRGGDDMSSVSEIVSLRDSKMDIDVPVDDRAKEQLATASLSVSTATKTSKAVTSAPILPELDFLLGGTNSHVSEFDTENIPSHPPNISYAEEPESNSFGLHHKSLLTPTPIDSVVINVAKELPKEPSISSASPDSSSSRKLIARPKAALPKTPPLNLFNTPSSQSLTYTSLQLTCIPLEIPPHRYLQRLQLSGNNLVSLPPSLFSACPKLKFLDVSENRLEILTAELGYCLELRELYVRSNNLQVVEEGSLKNLSRLEILDLSRNFRLERLPDGDFAELHRLKIVVLSGNSNMKRLPPSIGLLRQRYNVEDEMDKRSGHGLQYLLLDDCSSLESGAKRLADSLEAANLMVIGRINAFLKARRYGDYNDAHEDSETSTKWDSECKYMLVI